jgi:transposase
MTDQKLREWATPRQLEYLDAIDAHGSARKAAKALGVHKNVIQESYNRLKVRAASAKAAMLLAQGKPAQLLDNAEVRAVYLGHSFQM